MSSREAELGVPDGSSVGHRLVNSILGAGRIVYLRDVLVGTPPEAEGSARLPGGGVVGAVLSSPGTPLHRGDHGPYWGIRCHCCVSLQIGNNVSTDY